MKSLLLLFCAWWISAGVGRLALERWRVLQAYPLEQAVYASALGLGIAAYGILVIGLCGWLSFWPVTGWWIGLACIGVLGMRSNFRDIRRWARTLSPFHTPTSCSEVVTLTAGCLLVLFGVIGLLACFRPPAGHEWDALAYHLADPMIYLQQHRIVILPTEHHSNFPFTLEMLYAVGLLYDGFSLTTIGNICGSSCITCVE